MIRTAWVAIHVVVATLVLGLIAIVASLLRVRGPLYAWCTREWSRAILRASNVPVTVHGADHVDWTEPQILVANHVSWYDVFALASVIPTPFHFVGKKELDRIPFFGTAWKAAGHISIDRSDRQRAMESMRLAAEKIRRDGGIVIIFPEGTRSRTGELQGFKRGAFVLAVEADVRVIPTVIRGSERILRPGSARVTPHPVRVHVLPPISPAEAGGSSDSLLERVRARMLDALPA